MVVPELCISTHSPLVQSLGPTDPVSAPKAFTNTSEIQISPVQAEERLEVSLTSWISSNDSLSSKGARYEQSIIVISIIGYFLFNMLSSPYLSGIICHIFVLISQETEGILCL